MTQHVNSDNESAAAIEFLLSGRKEDAYAGIYFGRGGLKFVPALEARFQAMFQARDWRYIRILHVLLMALYFVYGAFDYVLLREDVGGVWAIRYLVAVPALMLLYCAGKNPKAIRYQQHYLVGGMSILIFTTLWMIAVIPPETASIYLASLLAMVMGGLTIARMRFWFVVTTGLIFLLGSIVILIPIYDEWRPLTYFLMLDGGAVLFCCAGAYAYEHALRREFLQQSLIEHQNLQLAEVNERLKSMVEIDALTGVYNRRYLDNALDDEWRRAKRRGSHLSLLMVDIDFFKRFNDASGHVQGDQCITRVAQCIKGGFHRPGDVVARYGGEEFAVLLPELGGEEALALANTVCQRVRELEIPHPASKVGPVVTVSVGVGEIKPAGNVEMRDLVRMADDALYRAKRHGRNRAELFVGVLPAFDEV